MVTITGGKRDARLAAQKNKKEVPKSPSKTPPQVNPYSDED